MGRVVNVVLAGLGGQGVIKASDILADAAFRDGRDVKKAEIHGMSQRGGSVTSDVRFGDEVLSPMIPRGEADFVVVCAASEVEVVRPLVREGGLLIPPDLVDVKLLSDRRSLNVALLGADNGDEPCCCACSRGLSQQFKAALLGFVAGMAYDLQCMGIQGGPGWPEHDPVGRRKARR